MPFKPMPPAATASEGPLPRPELVGLRSRGEAARRTTPGGQARYSDVAVELVLMLRLVFHLALRQAEGFAASVLRLLGQDLRVPDHTTLSRRGRGFAGRRPRPSRTAPCTW